MHERVDFILGVRNAPSRMTRAIALSYTVSGSRVVAVSGDETDTSKAGPISNKANLESGGEYRERGKNMSREARGGFGGSSGFSSPGEPGVKEVIGVLGD